MVSTQPVDDGQIAGLQAVIDGIRDGLDATNAAREHALPLCRAAIRHAANSIRAAHRREFDDAAALRDQSGAAVGEAAAALADFPRVMHAGFVHDAQKEYVEASITLALIAGEPLPSVADLDVQGPAYLHGLAESVGELRRHLLDSMRADAIDECERALVQMEEIYALLVTVDFPDALTSNLRRATDVARSLVERTRGDLTVAVQQHRLAERLERFELQ